VICQRQTQEDARNHPFPSGERSRLPAVAAPSFPKAQLVPDDRLRVAEQRRIIDKLAADIRFVPRPDLASLVNWGGASSEPLHRWFRYREAFAPALIDTLKLEPPFLDPFCGCGSMIVGAAERGFAAEGIDVNPLARFVAEVKLRPLNVRQLEEMQGVVAAAHGEKHVEQWEPRTAPAAGPRADRLAQRAIEEANDAALVARGIGPQRGGVRGVGEVPDLGRELPAALVRLVRARFGAAAGGEQ
jgi:hypothetical protein